MNAQVGKLRDWIASGKHRVTRRQLTDEELIPITKRITDQELSLTERAALRLQLFLEEESVVIGDQERIVGMRTITNFPDIYSKGEKEQLQRGHFVHEQGRICNISSDFEGTLRSGLITKRQQAEFTQARAMKEKNHDAYLFTKSAIQTIDAVIAFADRYAEGLISVGQQEAGIALNRSIRTGVTGFREGLQCFRILHFALWASNVYHNTVGRFDQYIWPYLKNDLDTGILDQEEALSLLEEFFLSFNKDSDLYIGMQQGDNGQSLVLGGCDGDGNCVVNLLTELCLTASLEVRMIDPKINLRVDSKTPLSLFERCTLLTKQGLGFPQYANDDVVIPGLLRLGYSLTDARNYVVAACWEFIVPGIGMDIPNIGAISLAGAVNDCIRNHLADCGDFNSFQEKLKVSIKQQAQELAQSLKPLWIEPAPFQSVLMTNCLDKGQDISCGATYNNYGLHGTGFANGVDQLSAVKMIFESPDIKTETLLFALNNNFEGNHELLYHLRETSPKLGRDQSAEQLADWFIQAFADALDGLSNERGGCFRAGTGSAMYYLWHAKELGALADGHMPGEPLSANFSPSMLLIDAGLLSVIRAFACPSIQRAINGGPLTLELHDTVFRNEEGIHKVAQLVRTYIQLGGHQLQLNSVSREKLLDAQKNPSLYQNLIVRVWGWSGHFVMLDKEYQDQIIARTSYNL